MKRTPIVLGGTVAGLVGVLAFHTTPARTALPAAASGAAGTGAAGTGAGGTGAGAQPQSSGSPAASAPAQGGPGTQPAGGTHSAVGHAVNYFYGVLSVQVTVSGSKIVKVGIASLDDGGNPRSQFIDQQAIPILEQQAMQAQSASIQGVSGASYTSAGFDQSLQSALHSLGLR